MEEKIDAEELEAVLERDEELDALRRKILEPGEDLKGKMFYLQKFRERWFS